VFKATGLLSWIFREGWKLEAKWMNKVKGKRLLSDLGLKLDTKLDMMWPDDSEE